MQEMNKSFLRLSSEWNQAPVNKHFEKRVKRRNLSLDLLPVAMSSVPWNICEKSRSISGKFHVSRVSVNVEALLPFSVTATSAVMCQTGQLMTDHTERHQVASNSHVTLNEMDAPRKSSSPRLLHAVTMSPQRSRQVEVTKHTHTCNKQATLGSVCGFLRETNETRLGQQDIPTFQQVIETNMRWNWPSVLTT